MDNIGQHISGADGWQLKNITDQNQTFLFRLRLGLPAGQTITLVDTPLSLGPQSAFPLNLNLPLPAAAPLGSWTLSALVAQPGPGLVELETQDFTLE